MNIKYLPNPSPRFSHYNDFIAKDFPHFLTEENPELYLIAGGDGSMLKAIQSQSDLSVSFLGRGLGTLNFLMNDFGEDKETLTNIINNRLQVELITTELISVSCIKADCEYELAQAVNEVVVGSDIMGYHSFQLDSNDLSLSQFQIEGTGVCLSTPLGSTAFNFNNSGKVLPLDSRLWSLTGVVCNRVLNDILSQQRIEITLLETKGQADLFIDGSKAKSGLKSGDKIILNSGKSVSLAFLNLQNFISRRNEISHRHRK